MKIYTSYFYQIRFFRPYQIPMSTAIWDPKWFHEGQGQDHVWKDKNGVWNGLRLEILNPDNCCSLPPECIECQRKGNPETCSFIKDYSDGLRTKVDFSELLEILNKTAEYIQQLEGFENEPEIVLIVHEASNEPCSERKSIQNLFTEHGIECTEWEHQKP